MELSQFVKESLLAILSGVEEAQRHIEETHGPGLISPRALTMGDRKGSWRQTGKHNRHLQDVEFDIAVTVAESRGSELGGKISIVAMGVGTDKRSSRQSESSNRMRFSIPICLPLMDDREASRTSQPAPAA